MLEHDATYIWISKHDIWAHRKIAVAQENALLRFHAGWSNFADWINDTVTGDNIFSCPAHLSAQLLARSVRNVIGHNGGSIASSMKHGCMDCTHQKRYRSDLINEGAILENSVDGVAIKDTGNELAEVCHPPPNLIINSVYY